jgi:hypothetical protein
MGRVVELEKHQSKISIIEQEFRNAELLEQRKLKEEEEKRRLEGIVAARKKEEAKRMERLRKMKAERREKQKAVSEYRAALYSGALNKSK